MRDDRAATPLLYIFSGLPGSGKSTLARQVARRGHPLYLRIDSIEQGLRDLCAIDVTSEGYRLAYRLASDNLRLGLSVVADSCNPLELTRRAWEAVAVDAGARFINIEVRCSDPVEHRARVEGRVSTLPGLRLPTWREVVEREYHPWSADRIMIDTAARTEVASFDRLWSELARPRPGDAGA